MGSVFGFVSSDLKSKIEILETLRQKENEKEFESFASMIEYEKSAGLLKKSDYVSGSRTLLRLHRGLGKLQIRSTSYDDSVFYDDNYLFVLFLFSYEAFIREFLYRLSMIEPTERTHSICQTAYNETLAQHHPWLIRKGAMVAMYTMPTREQLLNRVCADVERALSVLPDVLGISKVVFDRTEELYTAHDLHSLP